MPARYASSQRAAHRHQRSPALSPAKAHSGRGVLRSLPRDLENARNWAVMIAQTVCEPRSSGPVEQHPLRVKPVSGSIEQVRSGPPRMLRSPASDLEGEAIMGSRTVRPAGRAGGYPLTEHP